MNQKAKGCIFIFGGAFSFGILATIVKSAFKGGFSPGELMGCQDFFGLIILWILYFVQCLFKKGKNRETALDTKEGKNVPAKKTPWWKFLLAGILIGLSEIFYYKSLETLPVSLAIVMLMQYVWISVLIEAVNRKKVPTLVKILSVVVILLGTCLSGGIFSSSQNFNWHGALYSFLAAISYSFFLMTSEKVGTDVSPFKKSALFICGSCAVVFIVFPPYFLFNGTLFHIYKWGLALALFAAVFPAILFTEGIPKIGIALGAIISATELPIATIASYLVLKEIILPIQWFGVILMLLAIAMPNVVLVLQQRRQRWVRDRHVP